MAAADHTSWLVGPYPWEASHRLAERLGLPLVAAMVLAGRGMTDPDDARSFLECTGPFPDPFLFGHMEGAVNRLSETIDQGGRIVIHGDYDADGITATALMLLGLRGLGVEAQWYLPNRFNEGYGLSRTAVEAIAAEGPATLIAVDCGVNYPDEVSLARQLGLEVIVVDHHRPGPRLPECHLIHEVVGQYPHGDLCGVGLALKVMHALNIRRIGARRDALPKELDGLLDLVAIGTIADLAPLRGENRYYVREGLKLIAIGQRVGLRALAAVSGCTGGVDSGTVAFRLAPRLNAAGRLADPSPPLRLLLTDDEKEAGDLAGQLHELNGARQDVERQILDEAVARVEALRELPSVVVLAGPAWHEGVVGIVAARLVERYHRPTILLGVREGVAKGSGRSISAYDLMGGLNACADHLTIYGGHTQAVGLTMEAERVDDFRRAIEEHATRALSESDLTPTYHADAVLRGEDVNADTALALASLGPFGSGNPNPRVLVVDADIQQAEATRNGAHLRCMVEVDGVKVRGIGFGMGAAARSLRGEGRERLVGAQFRVDEWQGSLRPEFLLERVGGGVDSASPLCACGEDCARRDPMDPATEETVTSAALGGARTLRMPAARDLRDRPGRLSALAQVLATRERVMLVTCSVPHTLPEIQGHVPLRDLCGGAVECIGRGCLQSGDERVASAVVAVVEWDVGVRAPDVAGARAHVIAVDPPFRAAHVAFLRGAAEQGSNILLCYGDKERQGTAQLLRYLVHPRFAMVCLYRAMKEGTVGQPELYCRAAEVGWREARVVLTPGDLARAQAVLSELGPELLSSGEAKLEARTISAYVAAEADYQECSRLCLTL
jgi:single-stranded-DNA-specific exonuclease